MTITLLIQDQLQEVVILQEVKEFSVEYAPANTSLVVKMDKEQMKTLGQDLSNFNGEASE